MLVIKCVTLVTTVLSNTQGFITAVTIRFDRVVYEITYWNNGEFKTVWMNEGEFETTVESMRRIGFNG